MGRVEEPQVPRGRGVGRGIPSPLGKESREGDVPLPRKFFVFFENTIF